MFFSTIKSSIIGNVMIPLVLIIMCMLISWISINEFVDEYTLGCLLVTLGILYVCTIYLMMTGYKYVSSSLILSTIVIIITIISIANPKEKTSNYTIMSVTPLLSGICLAILSIPLLSV